MNPSLLLLLILSPAAAEENFDADLMRWQDDLNARIARVESECLGSGVVPPEKCEEAGPYTIGGQVFGRNPDDSFDRAEAYYDVVQLVRFGQGFGNQAGKKSFWDQVFTNFWLAMSDEEKWRQLPEERLGRMLRESKASYEQLRDKTVSRTKDMNSHQKIALATCVSARGFSAFNEDVVSQVKAGTYDTYKAARLPWQSFVTDHHPQNTGRGVCRDYAAVARDFLRAMGAQTRVVGSANHAMTEVTLKHNGEDDVYIVEPQRNGLEKCVLYRYSD